METGIDKKQLKKWIEKNWGTRCPEFSFGCPLCRAWRLYDEILEMLKDEI